jgi:hypothetical protein
MSASSSSISDPTARIPPLGGTGGAAYPQWRPQMSTYIMRQGIELRDYAKEIPQWQALVAAVELDAETEEQASIALLLGDESALSKSVSSALSPTKVKKENEPGEAQKSAAKKSIAAMIGRSRKAFAILYSALPPELRPLVADVPPGYAYGIWSFLEKKFRNTEQDSIAGLWTDFTGLSQASDELFDAYRARVDAVVELLKHAKQTVPSGLYTALMLGRLQQKYATAVLTLKTSGKVTDTDKIEWPSIVEYMSQYERNQLELGEIESVERTMAARTGSRPSAWQKNSQPAAAATPVASKAPSKAAPFRKRPLSEVQCFNCQEMGHYASKCKAPRKPRQDHPPRRERRGGEHPAKNRQQRWSRGNSSSEDEAADHAPSPKKPSERANMMRTLNRYDSLEHDEAEMKAGHRSYGAVALGISSESKKLPPVDAASEASGTKKSSKKPLKNSKAKSLDEALKTTAKAIDTAATVSTTCSKESLHNLRRCPPMPIRMANGAVLSAMHRGDCMIRLPIVDKPGKFVKVTIHDVYYHEQFDANLLSWGNMRKAGWEMHSTGAGTFLMTPKGEKIAASTKDNLTIIEDTAQSRVYGVKGAKDVILVTAKELVALHRRAAHASWSRLIEMCNTGATVGLGDLRHMPAAELAKAEKAIRSCSACIEAKAHRKSLGHGGLDKGTRAGEVLHMDTFYATVRDPLSGKKSTKYCLLGVDAFSEWRWSDAKSSMSEVAQAVVDMMQHSHTLTGRHPRLLIADLGSEFENRTVKKFCAEHGIQFQPSPARAKELNGLAEKNVDTMKNHVRSMLYSSKMPAELGWMYAIQHFVFVWNRTHVGQHTRVTPYQSMTGRESSVLNIGEFGCDVYVHQHRTMRDATFDRKAEPGIYFGHSSRQNCPMVLMLRSGKMILSKDVHFREGSFVHLRAKVAGRSEEVESVDLLDGLDVVPDMDDLDSPLPAREEQKHPESDEVVEESDEVAEQFEVKSITSSRNRDGVKEYRVKWVGYPASSDSWEPAASMLRDVPDVVQDYESRAASRVPGRMATRSQPSKSVAFESDSKGVNDEESDESESSWAAADAARRL